MDKLSIHPFFLDAERGQRFCIFSPAHAKKSLGAVLCIHPFAEELNKSRRMAALQAKAMAAAGYDVLQIDLFGCGDSAGDFGEASWQAWRADVLLAYDCLRNRSDAPLILWGLRAGCLLAASAAVDLPETPNFIFWQPVISGKQYWRQFMRLASAADMLAGQGGRSADKRDNPFAARKMLEIAGYAISPMLADSLQEAELSAPAGQIGRVAWLVISNRGDVTILPAVQAAIAQWQASGFDVSARAIRGPAFWQTAEIKELPDLLTETLSILETWR